MDETNQMNQIDQINEINQTNQIEPIKKRSVNDLRLLSRVSGLGP